MADPAQTPTDVTAENLAMLGDLAKAGVNLARCLERHALSAEQVQIETSKVDPYCFVLPPADYATLSQAFSRIARAVRMTVALRERIANPGPCRAILPQTRAPCVPTAADPDDVDPPGRDRECLFDTPDPQDPFEFALEGPGPCARDQPPAFEPDGSTPPIPSATPPPKALMPTQAPPQKQQRTSAAESTAGGIDPHPA
jgi:hypothetical protein